MNAVLQRLKERKLVQWAVAYLAGAWVLFEVSDAVGGRWGLPDVIYQGLFVVLAVGFFVTLVLAWYHGEKGRQRVSGPELLMIAVLLVIAGGVLSMLGPDRQESANDEPESLPDLTPADDRPGVAALPWTNLSGLPDDAYFVEGIHDGILTRLSKVGGLKVTPRQSVQRYRDSNLSVPQIAAELGVRYVLEAGLLRAGGTVRINAKLNDAATDDHVWAEEYDHQLSIENLLDVQSDLALEIVGAIGAVLAPGEQDRIEARPTDDLDAYDLYLRSLTYLHSQNSWLGTGGHEDLLVAQTLLERATALDPRFALAFARLSYVRGLRIRSGHDLSSSLYLSQEAAADSAMRLDPSLPEAHQAAGWVHYVREQFQEAIEDYAVALEGSPDDALTVETMGYAHRQLGNWPEVFAAYERVTRIDPREPKYHADLGGLSYQRAHMYEEAIEAYNRALALAPDHVSAAWNKGEAYCGWQGQIDTLRAMVDHTPGMTDYLRFFLKRFERDGDGVLALVGTGPDSLIILQGQIRTKSLLSAWAHDLRGDSVASRAAYDSVRVMLEAYEVENPDDWRVHYGLGHAYAGLGNAEEVARRVGLYHEATGSAGSAAEILARAGLADEAIDFLEVVLAGTSQTYPCYARILPNYDPIRDHPRFQALLEKYAVN